VKKLAWFLIILGLVRCSNHQPFHQETISNLKRSYSLPANWENSCFVVVKADDCDCQFKYLAKELPNLVNKKTVNLIFSGFTKKGIKNYIETTGISGFNVIIDTLGIALKHESTPPPFVVYLKSGNIMDTYTITPKNMKEMLQYALRE
jgi:hypothetical protein